mgnify:CR=1 FL=1
MMNKRIALLILIVILIFLATGCKGKSSDEMAEEIRKPVKVIQVEETLSTKDLEYIGIVKPEEMKKISFKTSGKIASIKVEKGQKIKKGDVIAALDTKELNLALEAAQAAKAGAEAQYMKAVNGATEEDIDLAASNVVKAQKAYEFAKDSFEKAKALYEKGGISKQDLDKAELELTIREQEYISAQTILQQAEKGAREEDKLALKSQLEQADVDLRYKESALSDAVLKSDVDGYVMEILSEEGELISAGYPVAILGTSRNIVNFGLTQEDATKVSIGHGISIEYGGNTYEAKIKSISGIKDSETQTYATEAILESGQLPSGAVVKIRIPTEEYYAVMIPLNTILRGDYDYVYVYQDGTAQKREITMGTVIGDLVEVSGLNKGEQLIVEGFKNIKHGDLLEIIQ